MDAVEFLLLVRCDKISISIKSGESNIYNDGSRDASFKDAL